MLVLNFPAFENKKYTAYDRFHGNGPYGKIPTKKEPIRTLGFALPYNKLSYFIFTCKLQILIVNQLLDLLNSLEIVVFETRLTKQLE